MKVKPNQMLHVVFGTTIQYNCSVFIHPLIREYMEKHFKRNNINART